MSSTESIPIVERAGKHPQRVAIISDGRSWSYRQLLDASAAVASHLLDGRADLAQARVAFLVPPGFEHVASQWGIWRAGGVAVPLATMHPAAELTHTIGDTQASAVVTHPGSEAMLAPLAATHDARLVVTAEALAATPGVLPVVTPDRHAMMLFTSGTTSRPKGVVTTHAMITAQVQSLVEAWAWASADHILNFLPMHHIHGIINVLSCALWSGAVCEFMAKFDAARTWQRLAATPSPTLLMAVPTIYGRLISAWSAMDDSQRRVMSEACGRLRLMVSGSAALPVSVLEKWREISGQTLLERYGMTEIGMALSNPLHGTRHPGCVGASLPGIDVRLAGEDGSLCEDGTAGEIQVRGPGVFREYWRREEDTRAAFTDDGWFHTGDVALRVAGVYRILGRSSVDIIKTGGYKVSALEIEASLLEHDAITQCAVVGIDDDEWGQRVAAAVVLAPDATLDLTTLRAWGGQRLAPYKVPSLLRTVAELPRNAMGKVNKPEVAKAF